MPESNAEQLAIEVLAKIGDLEKNMKRANALTAKAYSDMAKGSRSATRQMEADMLRSTTRINQAVALTAGKIGDAGKAFAGNLARNALAAGVALLSVAAIIGQTKQALQEFGDIADKSAQSGLDAEFFQELSYGASLAGVQMNDLSSALNTFSKNSGLAVVGKGKMVQALLKLNPALLENIRNTKSQEERVKLAADAIDQAKTASEKAAIATTLFGNAGAALVPVFSGGADAIERTAAKAQQLGIIISNDVIARADELGDEFETATKAIDVQFKSALINIAPLLVDAAKYASLVALGIQEIIDSISALENQSTRGLNQQMAAIGKQRLAIENQILEAQAAQSAEVSKMSDTAKNLGFADSENPELPGGTIDALKAESAELKKQELAVLAIIDARRQAAEESKVAAGGKGDGEDDAPDLPPITTGGSTRNQAAQDLERQQKAVTDLIADLEFEQTLIGKTEVEQAKMNALRQAGAAATEEQKAQIASLIEASAKEKAAVEATMQSVQLQRDILSGAMTDVRTAFEDGKITAQEWSDVLVNAIGKVADALQTQLINALITPAGGGFNILSLFGLGATVAGGASGVGAGAVTSQAAAKIPSAARVAAGPAANAPELRVKFVNSGLDITAEVEVAADGRIAKHTPGMIKKGVEDYTRHVLPGDVKKINARPRHARLDR